MSYRRILLLYTNMDIASIRNKRPEEKQEEEIC
jgi:hypothetical protein